MAMYHDRSSSIRCVEYFKENYSKFGIIKKITVFFESINFLVMTDYELESSHVTFVAETYSGNIIQLEGANCGYGGAGPGALRKILIFLGVDSDYANKMRVFSGLKFMFTEDGELINGKQIRPIFEGRKSNKDQLNPRYCHEEYLSRKIYISNPDLVGFIPILKMIELQSAYRIDYWFRKGGKLEKLDNDIIQRLNRSEHFLNSKDSLPYVKDINCEIIGEKFILSLLISDENKFAYINSLVLFVTGRPLFYEEISDDMIKLRLTNSKNGLLSRFFNILQSPHEGKIEWYEKNNRSSFSYNGSIYIEPNGNVIREVGEKE
jgi:hypothetical protein